MFLLGRITGEECALAVLPPCSSGHSAAFLAALRDDFPGRQPLPEHGSTYGLTKERREKLSTREHLLEGRLKSIDSQCASPTLGSNEMHVPPELEAKLNRPAESSVSCYFRVVDESGGHCQDYNYPSDLFVRVRPPAAVVRRLRVPARARSGTGRRTIRRAR